MLKKLTPTEAANKSEETKVFALKFHAGETICLAFWT